MKEFINRSESYSKINYDIVTFPETERTCKVDIWLPQNVLLGAEKDIEDIEEAFKKIIKNINQLK